jgi:hypothetical protein
MAGAYISSKKWREFYISATRMAPRVPKKIMGILNFVQQISGSFAVFKAMLVVVHSIAKMAVVLPLLHIFCENGTHFIFL